MLQTPREDYNVVIDLDRTLFDTDRFIHDIAVILETRFDVVNADRFISNVGDYYVQTGENLRTYDFFRHIESLGLDADEVETHLETVFFEEPEDTRNTYLYDDAPRFIEFLRSEANIHDIKVLTYGEERMQKLKLRLAATVLKDIECVIIQEPKGPYLAFLYSEGQKGIVVDDKYISDLPEDFIQVQVNRNNKTIEDDQYQSLDTITVHWHKENILGQLGLAA